MATVLVVDDDPTNREYLRTLLDHCGHRVHEAADGGSALAHIGGQVPDAVVTDVLMPGIDGYELARLLHSRAATSGLPIAFTTAHYESREIRSLARACGVQEVIPKPAQPAAVLASVAALLSGGRPADVTDVSAQDFIDQHRLVLNKTLLAKTGALQHSQTHATRLRAEVGRLAGLLFQTQQLTRASTWELDPRTGTILLSAGLCDLLRVASPSLSRKELWQRVHPEDRAETAAMAVATLRSGERHAVELRVAGDDGVIHELIVSCWRAPAEPGQLALTLRGVAQDVTPIRRDQRLRALVQAHRDAERRVRTAFHRAMVPPELPTVAGVDLAAGYVTASERPDSGGDWYDALVLADGRVLLSLGAAAGHHGLSAAVAGSARTVTRAYAINNPDPASVLSRLNQYLTATHRDDTFLTAVVALYEPASRQLYLANAGHPHPLLITPSRAGIPLSRPGPALGIFPDACFDVQRLTLAPGTALCMYTDGLIDQYASASVDEYPLGRVAALGDSGNAQLMIDQILAGTPHWANTDDDKCVMILRAHG